MGLWLSVLREAFFPTPPLRSRLRQVSFLTVSLCTWSTFPHSPLVHRGAGLWGVPASCGVSVPILSPILHEGPEASPEPHGIYSPNPVLPRLVNCFCLREASISSEAWFWFFDLCVFDSRKFLINNSAMHFKRYLLYFTQNL